MNTLINSIDIQEKFQQIEEKFVSKAELDKKFQSLLNCVIQISPEMSHLFNQTPSYLEDHLNTYHEKFVFKFNNQVKLIDGAIQKLLRSELDIAEMKEKIKDKINIQGLNEELSIAFKQIKEKFEKDAHSTMGILMDQINANQEHTANLNNSILNLEKDVLWRIKECERLLSTRVTKDYVNQMNQELTVQLNEKKDETQNQAFMSFQTQINEINLSMNNTNETIQRGQKQVKEELNKINMKMITSFISNDKMDIIKQCLNERIQDVNSRVMEHQIKFEQMGDIENVQKSIVKIQMDQQELEKQVASASSYIQEVVKKLDNFKNTMKQIEAGPQEMYKIGQEILSLSKDFKEYQFNNKADASNQYKDQQDFKEKVLQQFQMIRQEQSQIKIDSKEVLQILEKEMCMPHSLVISKLTNIVSNHMHLNNGMSIQSGIQQLQKDNNILYQKLQNYQENFSQFQNLQNQLREEMKYQWKIVEQKLIKIEGDMHFRTSTHQNSVLNTSAHVENSRMNSQSTKRQKLNKVQLNKLRSDVQF